MGLLRALCTCSAQSYDKDVKIRGRLGSSGGEPGTSDLQLRSLRTVLRRIHSTILHAPGRPLPISYFCEQTAKNTVTREIRVDEPRMRGQLSKGLKLHRFQEKVDNPIMLHHLIRVFEGS